MYLESRDESCEKNKEKQLYDFLKEMNREWWELYRQKGKIRGKNCKEIPGKL